MRMVRWTAEERVDIPDITAMSFQTLGEFRRTVRALLSGPTGKYVIRGFAVEPEAVPSSRVRVRLQPPGQERGVAVGAESLVAGLDYGQVIGDRDSNFINEGQSQQLLDLIGQPVGTYYIELRFTYADGANDNRAFWNPAGVTEFVLNVPTRRVSGWEIRYVGALTGAEWVPLASIAWGGAVVNAGNITDLRDLFFEGVAPYQATTQNAVSGLTPDFSRSTARDTLGVQNAHDAIRALQRQIQDLKGADDNGEFNWFGRVASPYDPTDALGTRTKNLRGVDIVSYTVADGVTSFGDFNGATGINDCLNFIAAMPAANLPNRVVIKVKGGSVTYTWSGQKLIVPAGGRNCSIRIEGEIDHSTVSNLFARPTVQLAATDIAAGAYMLGISGGTLSSLELRRLNVTMTGATGNRGMFYATGAIVAEDCLISQAAPDVNALYVLLSSFAQKCFVSHCDISGRVNFYSTGAASTAPGLREHGVIQHTRMTNAQVVLHADAALGAVTPDMVNGFVFRNVALTAKTGTIYNSSVGMIDAACAQHLYLIDVNGAVHGDEGGLAGYVYNTRAPSTWRVRGCSWTTNSTGTHGVGAGTGAADGTGWAIRVVGATATPARDIQIEGGQYGLISIDSGGVLLKDVGGFNIHGMCVDSCSDSGAGAATCTALAVRGTVGASATMRGSIVGFNCGNWINSGVNNLVGIEINEASFIEIAASLLSGLADDRLQTSLPAFGASMGALKMSNTVNHVTCTGTTFLGWAVDQATGKCVTYQGACMFSGCTWRRNGGYVAVGAAAGSGANFTGCRVDNSTGSANAKGFDLRSQGQAVVSGCSFNFTGAARDAVRVDTATYALVGNTSLNGDIRRDGVPAGRGYNEAADLNYLSGCAYV